MSVDPTLVHTGPHGRCRIWQRCESATYILVMEFENHGRWEWRAAGEVILRKIYEDHPAEWACIVIRDDGKECLGSKPTKEEAWAVVEGAYSSVIKQDASVCDSSTS